MLRAFQWDCTDSLALLQQGGLFSGDKGEQAVNGRQPGVSRSGGTPPLPFHVIQETNNHLFCDIFDREPVHRPSKRIGRIAQQQLNGVTVGQNGIGREAFLHGQIVAEESFHAVG